MRFDCESFINKCFVNKICEKQVKKLPKNIKEALRYWAVSVEKYGIREIRKLPGYHDEPLKGIEKVKDQ